MLTLKAKLLTSTLDRLLGLIFKSKPETIMFYTHFGIHTIGLRFPIDVIVLNKENVVVKLSRNLKPNRFFFWPLKYEKVIELPEGFVDARKIKPGDKIALQTWKKNG